MGEAEPGLAAPFEAVEQISVARTSTLKDRIAAAFDDTESRWWHLVNRFVFLAIVISVGATVIETVPSFELEFRRAFDTIEVATIALFTVELALRIWCADSPVGTFGKRRHPRLAYMLSPAGMVRSFVRGSLSISERRTSWSLDCSDWCGSSESSNSRAKRERCGC